MKELYKGFKKVNEDDQSATLKHENGHELTVAKSGLNKQTLKMLKDLPLHQADGTELGNGRSIEEVLDPTLGLQNQDQQFNELQQQIEASKQSPEPFTPQYTPTEPYESKRQVIGDQAIGPIDYIVPNLTLSKPGEEGLPGNEILRRRLQEQQVKQEIRNEEAKAALAPPTQPTLAPTEQQVAPKEPRELTAQPPAQAKLAQKPVDVLAPEAVQKQPPMTDEAILESPTANLVQKQQAVTRIYQKTLKDLTQKAEEERQKIKEIDPNRLWNNLSTWGKIRNTIGLVLGGIGGGLTHQENPALRALDRMIEQDVEAQKQDQTNRMNLYKFHLERLKDSQAAYESTMKNLKDVVMNQMEMDMLMIPGNPAYKQAVANKLLDMEVQRASKLEELAGYKTRQLVSSSLQKGKSFAQQDPSLVASQVIKDKDTLKDVQKEIGRRKQLKTNAPLIMDQIDKVIQDYRGMGGVFKTPDSIKDLEVMVRGLVPDVAGDTTGAAKEATVQKLVNLLKPEGKFDVMFSDPESFRNRIKLWLTQNLVTHPVVGGMTLDDFEQTRIDPNAWDTVPVQIQGQLRYVPKDKVEAFQQRAQQLGHSFKLGK
jgi:hypothetical protein